jgi:hypothetical protein
MAANRSFVSGNFKFELDGLDCGLVNKFEGGNFQAEVVNVANSSGYLQYKHLGPVKLNDVKFQMAGIMGEPLQKWIQAALDMNHMYKNAAIYAYDFNQKCKSIREYQDCLLTEFGLPACDGAAKDPAYVSISFAAQNAATKPGDDSNAPGQANMKQKFLLGSNFKLTIDKIGAEGCRRINKSDALTWKMAVARDDIGAARVMELCPGKIDGPNLSCTIAGVDAKAFSDWHEDFVIKGNCGQDMHTTAELVYYSQDFTKELIRVTFKEVGIFNLTFDPLTDHDDKIWRAKAEMYFETSEIAFPGA